MFFKYIIIKKDEKLANKIAFKMNKIYQSFEKTNKIQQIFFNKLLKSTSSLKHIIKEWSQY